MEEAYQIITVPAGATYAFDLGDDTIVASSNGLYFTPEQLLDYRFQNGDNGNQLVVYQKQEMVQDYTVYIEPMHAAHILSPETKEITVYANDTYDVSKFSSRFQWTLISLELVQRVQRRFIVQVIIDDARATLSYVLHNQPMPSPPQAWKSERAKLAMLRLLDTGSATHTPFSLSDGVIYVDWTESNNRLDSLALDPRNMIAQMGSYAHDLLRIYMSLEMLPDLIPEVVPADSAASRLSIPLDAYFDNPSQHNSLSLVAVAHRQTYAGEWKAVAIHDIHVLPSSVSTLAEAQRLMPPARKFPTNLPAISAQLDNELPPTSWNNYNLGFRRAGWYRFPGETPKMAAEGFTNSGFATQYGIPLAQPLTDTTFLPFDGTRGNALYLAFSDFGDDPFLSVLIHGADESVPNAEVTARDSFAKVNSTGLPGWAPRRLEGGTLVLKLEQKTRTGPPKLTREAQIAALDEAQELLRRNSELSATRDTEIDSLIGREALHPFKYEGAEKASNLVLSAKYGKRLRLVEIAQQVPVLATALKRASTSKGVRIRAFLRQTEDLLDKTGQQPNVAEIMLRLIGARLVRLDGMRAQYGSLPPVDNDLTFDAVSLWAVANASREDKDFIRNFGMADELLGIAFMEWADEKRASDVSTDEAEPVPKPKVKAEPKGQPPAFQAPPPVVSGQTPLKVEESKLASGGALPLPRELAAARLLSEEGYPRLKKAVTALAGAGKEKLADEMLLKTGLAEPLRNVENSNVADQPLSRYYENKQYARVDQLPEGSLLAEILTELKKEAEEEAAKALEEAAARAEAAKALEEAAARAKAEAGAVKAPEEEEVRAKAEEERRKQWALKLLPAKSDLISAASPDTLKNVDKLVDISQLPGADVLIDAMGELVTQRGVSSQRATELGFPSDFLNGFPRATMAQLKEIQNLPTIDPLGALQLKQVFQV